MTPEHLDKLIGTTIGAGITAFFVYRRFRRNFGRQRVNRGALKFRVGLFLALSLLVVAPVVRSAAGAASAAAGLAAGLAVAAWAAGRTRFEERDGNSYYTPHPYAGLAVSLLFLGRLVYRYAAELSVPAPPPPADPSAALARSLNELSCSPATLLVFFLLAGYYVYYYLYLLRNSSRPVPAVAESRPGSRIAG